MDSTASNINNILSYDECRNSCHPQNFSIPEPILYYMAKNSTLSPNLYQKLAKTCKYFFIKNPISIFHCLHFDGKFWQTCVNGSCSCNFNERNQKYINMDLCDTSKTKILVTNKLKISGRYSHIAAALIPTLYNGNYVTSLELVKQQISFNDLLLFSKNLEYCSLDECIISDENGDEIPYESIVSNFKKLTFLNIIRGRNSGAYDFSKTAKELIKIPHFKNFSGFGISGVSESFDIGLFFDFLKKIKTIYASIGYKMVELSDEYKDNLQMIVDEILDEPRNYFPLFISFDGQLRQYELLELYYKNL